jgi:hypothetical protein
MIQIFVIDAYDFITGFHNLDFKKLFIQCQGRIYLIYF